MGHLTLCDRVDPPDTNKLDIDIDREGFLERRALFPPGFVRLGEHLICERHLLMVQRFLIKPFSDGYAEFGLDLPHDYHMMTQKASRPLIPSFCAEKREFMPRYLHRHLTVTPGSSIRIVFLPHQKSYTIDLGRSYGRSRIINRT